MVGTAVAIATRMAERQISLESIVQRSRPAKPGEVSDNGVVPVILMTYATSETTIREVLEAVEAQGWKPAGPLHSYHLRTSSTEFDFEVGVAVAKPITPTGRVRMSGLPAARVARTIYRGPYEGLFGAWSEFGEWMKSEGRKGTGQVWERYMVAPDTEPDPSHWQTELNIPLAE